MSRAGEIAECNMEISLGRLFFFGISPLRIGGVSNVKYQEKRPTTQSRKHGMKWENKNTKKEMNQSKTRKMKKAKKNKRAIKKREIEEKKLKNKKNPKEKKQE